MCSLSDNTYAYIPGKNWKLSLAELISFLKMKDNEFRIIESSKAFFIATTNGQRDPEIERLGGMLKIGKVISTIETRTLERAYIKKDKMAQEKIEESFSSNDIIDEMLSTRSSKLVFGVSIYCLDGPLRNISKPVNHSIGSIMKHELSLRGKKSRFLGFPKLREQPQLTHVEVLKKSLVKNKAEVLLCVGRKQSWISKTIAVHNPFEFQKRDTSRPVQRRIFAMPPRLARIMVNLASCEPDMTLVDPFCGVGTILQEALLTGAKVIGLDWNPWCVNASRVNLRWLIKEYRLRDADYTILHGDARHLTDLLQDEIDCIATEPDLGPALRQVPTTPYARRIIEKLVPVYSDFLREAYEVLKKDGRLVMVTPYVKTRSGEPVTMHIEQKAKDFGFKTCYPFQRHDFAEEGNLPTCLTRTTSFVDVAERHKIGREILILRK
jgi:tRNA G10  N-methylase Trm11